MKKVQIFTDGACSKNPGPGGWAAILRYKNVQKKISGFVSNTTNNRMELFALISALRALKVPCEIKVFSDSKYLINSISKVHKWKKRKKSIPNVDLWDTLIELSRPHKISMIWEKGHNGNTENEECDKTAREEIKNNT